MHVLLLAFSHPKGLVVVIVVYHAWMLVSLLPNEVGTALF